MEFRDLSRCSFSLLLIPTVAVLLINSIGHGESSPLAPSANVVYDDQVSPTVCRHCGSQHCQCELICRPQKVSLAEEKSLWKVTCEYVCIPGFRFPWECRQKQCGCEPLVCGTVRAVNVLEKEEYECETCGYEWEVTCVRRSGDAGNAGCQCPRCAAREQQTRVAAEKVTARK
jgi:hypothetical protein